MLPTRLWPWLDDYLPVSESAFPAALLTFLAGAAIGIPGFFEYATEQASMNTAAMLEAAQALIRTQFQDISGQPDTVVGEFRARFCDTEVFYDVYAGAKFAHYLLARHAELSRWWDAMASRPSVQATRSSRE